MVQRIGKKRFTDDVEVAGSVVSDSLFVSDVEVDTSNASSDQALIFNGTKFSPGFLSGRVEVSSTAPVSPAEGDVWFDSTTGSAFVYYDSFWVEFGPAGATGPEGPIVPLGDLTNVDLTGLSDGDYIRYDSTSGDWLPEAPLVTQTDIDNVKLVVSENKTASYTLALTDAYKAIEMNVATANNLTVPPNGDVAFPTGTQIIVIQTGAGATTLVAGSGVTVNSKDGNLELGGQFSGVTLIKRGTDSWIAVGDLA